MFNFPWCELSRDVQKVRLPPNLKRLLQDESSFETYAIIFFLDLVHMEAEK